MKTILLDTSIDYTSWDINETGSIEMTEWQPIETAPKDGTEFEGKLPDGAVFTIKWKRDAWAFDYGECWLVLNPKNQPTHWMPLPTPPKKENE